MNAKKPKGWANMHDWRVYNTKTKTWVNVTASSAYNAWRNTPNSGFSFPDAKIEHVRAHDL